MTQGGKVIDIDDFNVVTFELSKISTVSSDANTAPKVVYDRNGAGEVANISNSNAYINFKPSAIRAQRGLANYAFSSKNDDIDVVFDANILTKDRSGKVIVDKKAQSVTFRVRSLRISVESQINNTPTSVISAGSPSVLFNLKKINKDAIVPSSSLPYTLNIYDDISNALLRDPINVGSNTYTFTDAGILNTS